MVGNVHKMLLNNPSLTRIHDHGTHPIFVLDQWGLFDRQFGRTDTDEADPEGRIPLWEKASVQEMKDKFSAVGFGPRQVLPIFYHYFCSFLSIADRKI